MLSRSENSVYSSRTASSSEGSEVFRKEKLERKTTMEEKRGKQKRRDSRVSKTKTSKRTGGGGGGGDVLAQIKAKENIVAPKSGGQRITISRENASLLTQKAGIYNKGKASLMVSRRRPLHDLQPSERTARETEKDLRRVLSGYNDRSPRKQQRNSSERGGGGGRRRGGGGEEEDEGRVSPSPPPLPSRPVRMKTQIKTQENKKSSSEMELSPEASESVWETSSINGDAIYSIAERIAEGLHPTMVYSDSQYLHNTMAELRKLLKQGSDVSGEELADMRTLVEASLSTLPPANGVAMQPSVVQQQKEQQKEQKQQQQTTTLYDSFSLPLFDDGSSSTQQQQQQREVASGTTNFTSDILNPTIFAPSASPPPPPPPPPVPEMAPPHLTEIELTTTTTSTDISFPPPPPSTSPLPPSPPVGLTCVHYHLDPLAPPPPPSSSPMLDQPHDFLDLLDTMQHHEEQQMQGVTMIRDHPSNFSRPPGSKWMPTPERPQMFRQKLY